MDAKIAIWEIPVFLQKWQNRGFIICQKGWSFFPLFIKMNAQKISYVQVIFIINLKNSANNQSY